MVEQAPSEIEGIAARYMAGLARVDPYAGLRDGVVGDGPTFTDYSTAGVASRLDLASGTLAEVRRASCASREQRVTAAWLHETTLGEIGLWEDDLHTPLLRLLDGPIVDVIIMFRRILGRDPIDWDGVLEYLSHAPESIASIQSNLVDGIRRKILATRRQAEVFAEYCEDSGGMRGRGVLDWLIAGVDVPSEGREEIVADVASVQNSLLELADFVRREYLPATHPTRLIDAQHYRRRLRYYAGGELDPHEIYKESWLRFCETMNQLRLVARDIASTGDVDEAIWLLEADANEQLHGDSELCDWLSLQIDQKSESLLGGPFPLKDERSSLEVRLSRGESKSVVHSSAVEPGQTSILWVKETGEFAIPKWRYLVLCHAVAIPGIWYQRNRWTVPQSPLTRAQRQIYPRFAYAGWGHYATQLLNELGHYTTPAARLSFLQRELLQSVRVLVDVGYNLGLSVPENSEVCAGDPWSETVGTQFIAQAVFMSRQLAAGEMRRAISSAGQFPSYRARSDAISRGRSAADVKIGSDEDLRQFHTEVLNLGPLGLDDLKDELASLPMITAESGTL